MKILILGVGAVGGYFGARMVEAGGEMTFLARPSRAEHLRSEGLRVMSPFGDVHIRPNVVTAEELPGAGIFDIILLACKAYDLASAIDSVAPAVGNNSLVLPLLNGIRHLDVLDNWFGSDRVLGGSASSIGAGVPIAVSKRTQYEQKVFSLLDYCRIVDASCTATS